MYRLAYVTNFLLTASAGLVFVFLADLQDRFGFAGWQIGVIASIGFLSSLVISLVVSPLVDRGRLRPVAAIALVAGITGNLLFALGDEFAIFVTGRALIGVGVGLFLVVGRKALIGLDTAGSGEKMGALLSAGVAGFVAGPPLGATLERISFEAPFLVITALLMVVTVPVLSWIGTAPVATSAVRIRDMLPLLRRPGVQGALLAQLFLFATVGVFDSIADRYLTDLGASNTMVALILVSFGVPLLILPSIAGRRIDAGEPRRMLVVALVLLIPTVAAFGLVETLLMFAIVGILEGTLDSFAFPANQVVVVDETGAHEAAIGQALLDAAGLVAAALAAVAAPATYEAVGPRSLYLAFAVIGAGLTLGAVARFRASSPRPAARMAGL